MKKADIDPEIECSVCGTKPIESIDEYKPDLVIINHNFGSPYLYGVACPVCYRLATGIGEKAAIEAWESGSFDGEWDYINMEVSDEEA